MPPECQCVKHHWLILLLISSSILIQANIAKKQPTRTTIEFVMVVERFLQLLDMPLLFKVIRSSNFKNWWIEMILANYCQEWAYKLVYQIPLLLCFISFKLNSVNCSRLLLKGFIFPGARSQYLLGCCTVTELSAENGIKQRMCLKYPR